MTRVGYEQSGSSFRREEGRGGAAPPGSLVLSCAAAMTALGSTPLSRGLHSFPFPLNLSLLCPFPLNLS